MEEEQKECLHMAIKDEELKLRMKDPIWSRPEKAVLETVYTVDGPLHNPETGEQYTTVTTQAVNGEDQTIYLIPYHQMEDVVRKLWPFEEELRFDMPYIDLHSGKEVYLKNISVIRMRDRNVLVAPDYLSTGGMVVDLVNKADVAELASGGYTTTCKKLKRVSNDATEQQ